MKKISAAEGSLREAPYALENALFRDYPGASTSVVLPKDMIADLDR